MSTPVIVIYTTKYCGFCQGAKQLLEKLGLAYEEVPVDGKPDVRRKASEAYGNWPTVPMIEVDGKFIGGFTELKALHQRGGLGS